MIKIVLNPLGIQRFFTTLNVAKPLKNKAENGIIEIVKWNRKRSR